MAPSQYASSTAGDAPFRGGAHAGAHDALERDPSEPAAVTRRGGAKRRG